MGSLSRICGLPGRSAIRTSAASGPSTLGDGAIGGGSFQLDPRLAWPFPSASALAHWIAQQVVGIGRVEHGWRGDPRSWASHAPGIERQPSAAVKAASQPGIARRPKANGGASTADRSALNSDQGCCDSEGKDGCRGSAKILRERRSIRTRATGLSAALRPVAISGAAARRIVAAGE